jgi:outer membrane protein assembly factor BamE (lipoprotein component of BamABCDE complex)
LTEQQFDRFAEQGIVVAGMTSDQVELALGKPSQIETFDENGNDIVVWWYENRDRRKVIFASNGVVRSIEKL